jgi:hypothetical protein
MKDKHFKLFQGKTKPLLSLLVTMREQLRHRDAASILRCNESEIELLSIDIGAMFPTIGEGDDKRFTVYHKTVLDWLMDRAKSQRSADNQIN